MSCRARTWNYKSAKKVLEQNGYYEVRCRGDHHMFRNADGNVIPLSPRANKMVFRRMIREHNLVVTE